MARIAPVPERELTRGTRFWMWLVRRTFGRVLRPYPYYAHVPRLVPIGFFASALFGTGQWHIGSELRTLIHLRVAALIGCVF